MWARMTKHKLLIKGNKTAPNYDQPQFIHLHEWDSWVVTYTKRRELKAHVTKLGAKIFVKNKFRRWRYQARFMAAQNERLALAVQHHNNAKLLQVTKVWGGYCQGRGKAARRREVYLTAWANWAPRKRR